MNAKSCTTDDETDDEIESIPDSSDETRESSVISAITIPTMHVYIPESHIPAPVPESQIPAPVPEPHIPAPDLTKQ